MCYVLLQPEDRAMRRRFVSYAFVAVVSAAVSAAITAGGISLVGGALQTAANTGTIPLMTQPLPDLPGREVRMTLLDRVPGNASVPHRHPGHHTFGYVVEGQYEL